MRNIYVSNLALCVQIVRSARLAQQYKGLPEWRTNGAHRSGALLQKCPNSSFSLALLAVALFCSGASAGPQAIVSVQSSKCLQVRNSNFKDGTAVETYVCFNVLSFVFRFFTFYCLAPTATKVPANNGSSTRPTRPRSD
jgi:hypothetical protein